MIRSSYAKLLSANDVGDTGSHQAGILVPKSDSGLLAFLPKLDPSALNPDAWLICEDENGNDWTVRYIYYNNRLHTEHGTRNEYRLTHLTSFIRRSGAMAGDQLILTATSESDRYRIAVNRRLRVEDSAAPRPIVLRGWRRIH